MPGRTSVRSRSTSSAVAGSWGPVSGITCHIRAVGAAGLLGMGPAASATPSISAKPGPAVAGVVAAAGSNPSGRAATRRRGPLKPGPNPFDSSS